MKCFLFFSPLIAIPPRSWSYHALDHPQGISNAGSFSPAQRCSQWHIFISGGGSREGAACVWTVWSPYRIQEMSLPSLWQTSCSHGFESSQLDGRLCKSGPRDVHPPPAVPTLPSAPARCTWPWLSSYLSPENAHLSPCVLDISECHLTWDRETTRVLGRGLLLAAGPRGDYPSTPPKGEELMPIFSRCLFFFSSGKMWPHCWLLLNLYAFHAHNLCWTRFKQGQIDGDGGLGRCKCTFP